MSGEISVPKQCEKAEKCGMTREQWLKARAVAQGAKGRGRRAAGTAVDFSTPVEGQLDMFAE
jgi:hypothetical protein